MLKLIALVIVVLVVMLVLKNYLRSIDAKRQPNRTWEGDASMSNTMVRCAQCGVHVPRSESVFSRSKFFCSDEHRLVHFK